jgi:hypothetical protein
VIVLDQVNSSATAAVSQNWHFGENRPSISLEATGSIQWSQSRFSSSYGTEKTGHQAAIQFPIGNPAQVATCFGEVPAEFSVEQVAALFERVQPDKSDELQVS